MAAMGTEKGGRTLALARELAAYVIAADLVGLPESDDAFFRAWLKDVRKEMLSGKTLISTHEVRPNNWGTQAGASRAAIAAYLQEDSELARCAKIFRGWLGDRSSYSKFEYKDPTWQADPLVPVGINPPGTFILGYSVDGALPEELRRSGEFIWPPPKQNYVYTALEGAIGQAMILHRAGYDVWNWQDQALLRAYRWLHEQANFPAVGNDTWQPHVINCYYGTHFPAPVPAIPGKSVGWTEWTHGYPAAIQTGIHGVVKNALSGYEVIEANVELKVGSETRYSAVSNINGCYDFVNAVPGTYTISCSTPGFEAWSEEVTLETGKQIFARRIRLQPDFSDTTPPAPPLNLHLVVHE
jgi:hypothetical protein